MVRANKQVLKQQLLLKTTTASQTESSPTTQSSPSTSSSQVSSSGNSGLSSDGVNLQRSVSRVPFNQSAISDSGNPAWEFNDGVLEQILATSRARGYITGNQYILERVNIVNGNGYYNLYRPDGTYLFTLNCKTGYFVGNGSGHADDLDYYCAVTKFFLFTSKHDKIKDIKQEECHMTKANFGVVGMAVMGRNLALNIESRGYTVAIYNRSKESRK